jgi:hypothetical protein
MDLAALYAVSLTVEAAFLTASLTLPIIDLSSYEDDAENLSFT